MSNDELNPELLAMCKMLAEAQAARDKYGDVLSPDEEFLLEAECEAIAQKAMESDPAALKIARDALIAAVIKEFGDKEWSEEKMLEEFLKLQPARQ